MFDDIYIFTKFFPVADGGACQTAIDLNVAIIDSECVSGSTTAVDLNVRVEESDSCTVVDSMVDAEKDDWFPDNPEGFSVEMKLAVDVFEAENKR